MHLHTLKPKTSRITSMRVGRGGKRGKTSGRGTKGQKARAGRKLRPEMRDIMRRYPKRRGYGKNRGDTHVYRIDTVAVNLATLEKTYTAGSTVSPSTLADKGILSARQASQRTIKILATGNVTKKVSIAGCLVSPAARAKIEAAGGTVTEVVKDLVKEIV